MVKFINGLTNTEMWVSDDRVDEYKAAGHRLAATTENHTEEPIVEEKPKKRTKKKG